MKITSLQYLSRIPSLIVIFILMAVIFFNIKSSSHRDISIFSYFSLFILLTISSYLIYSLFRSDLLRLNNFILYLIVTSGILLELVLRANPALIPRHFLMQLSSQDRKKLAEERGLLVYNTRICEGQLLVVASQNKQGRSKMATC